MEVHRILILTTTVLLVLTMNTSSVVAQSNNVVSLEELGIDVNFVFGYDSGNDIVTDIEATSDSVYIGGYANFDSHTETSGRGIITQCNEVSPSFITGEFADTTSNCGNDAVISKLHHNGSIEWSTFLGGADSDKLKDIALDEQHNLIVTGTSDSPDFPLKNEYDNTVDSLGDVFITKFQPNGFVEWSTFIGGSYVESVYDVLTDSQDNIIVVGMTKSKDFPILNAFDSEIEDKAPLSRMDSFVAKFNPDGDLLWSSYLGGSDIDLAYATAMDDDDNIIIAGVTRSVPLHKFSTYSFINFFHLQIETK